MSEIVRELKSVGINADTYRRGPLGKHNFAISIVPGNKRGTVKLWEPENVVADVFGDQEFRQAVLKVEEGERQVKRNVEVLSTPASFRTDAIQRFRWSVGVPSNAKFSVKKIREREYPARDHSILGGAERKYMTAEITATIPSSTQNLLTGMDETYHFIAELPRAAKSVEQAHRLLRPAGLSDGALRQGEWFFEPCSESMQKKLFQLFGGTSLRGSRKVSLAATTHIADSLVRHNGQDYALGFVKDSRRSHHKPLYLPTWHKVVRNREVVGFGSNLRRTWD